jgi:HAD superfamily hydrolase (TIGR01459 family)
MQRLTSLTEILDRFDAFLCDLWGVIHDGEHLYPNVLETLEMLNEAGKPVMFLSNAPRTADSVIQKMKTMGVRREWYLSALTSGEAAQRYLLDMPNYAVSENAFLLGGYYYQGLESDAAMLEGLPQPRVKTIEEATFILNGNFDYHGQPLEEILPRLQTASARGLPMLCINPDLEVVKQDGTQILCAGFLAGEYEKLGGKVGYIGKPHPLVFEMASDELSGYLLEAITDNPSKREVAGAVGFGAVTAPFKNKIAMIGDNLLTDIKGGKAAGLATVLVTQGVHQGQPIPPELAPDYLISSFC